MHNTPDAIATLARLPDFKAIDPTTLVADLETLLGAHRARLATITADPANASWQSVVEPMDAMADELKRTFSPVSHLHHVADSEALREPYNACIALLSEYGSELAQNAELCRCYQHIHDSAEFHNFEPARRKVIENALRDFRLGGVQLPPAEQAVVKRLNIELARLGTQFEENLLDATQAFKLRLDNDQRLAGLPDAIRALTRQNAEREHYDGYILTLDLPCYLPAMQRLEDRDLRRTLYEAYVTRASELGPHGGQYDNSVILCDILARRQELARALGFASYADLSLANKMAPDPAAVTDFLLELAARARPAAERELAELGAFARDELGLETIEAWDVAFCSERYREHCFRFSQEDLRPYFPATRVLDGMFQVASTLFDIRFEAIENGIDRWDEAVRFYAICDSDDQPIGFFFLDLYARAGKRSGAWMDECLVRWRHDDTTQLPVAYLVCNFTPPVADQPTLLTHDDVITVFHEFGHGLHHMLTRIEQPAVAGINGVAWDAVELPSQILENWAWEKEALDLISGHYQDGHTIPDDLYERVRSAKRFQAAMQTLRQVELALFDFRAHMEYTPGFDIQALLDEVRATVAVLTPPEWNRFQHSFSHIFAGGYAAGYYSYKWAEVLAADAYARFEDEGIFNRETGLEFRHAILEMGGAEDAMALFKRFRGREPSVEPLLRQAGLIT